MFCTDDPAGRKVTLKASTWNKHIVTSHPELYKQDMLVKKTIESPEIIIPDRANDDRENFLRLCILPGVDCVSILKVVVDFSASIGDVVTAYPMLETKTQAPIKRGVIYERS